ncbi:MAG TPA: gamma-glutamyl-gamma-aminobutyrate hydrolase family protein [Clostridia bacterium]|nr:gamma-glutamyl-gamma-aminobutyrate hydrolase family protein [Clostridia bacterium]
MKPRIAIPTPNSDAAYSTRTLPKYMGAVERAGGEPVEVSILATPGEIAQLGKTCDAVLLPGSHADVDPQRFGAERDPRTAAPDPRREDADELLIQDAHNMRKPILGICFGMQSLNVWRTGTLVQHIESPVRHARSSGVPTTESITHPVVVESHSLLARILGQQHGSPKITVNSSHHQSVQIAGDGLRVCARCPDDGIIEAIENVSPAQFIIGVQWHPERTYDEDEQSKAIFRALIEAARQWHERMMNGGKPDFESIGH